MDINEEYCRSGEWEESVVDWSRVVSLGTGGRWRGDSNISDTGTRTISRQYHSNPLQGGVETVKYLPKARGC